MAADGHCGVRPIRPQSAYAAMRPQSQANGRHRGYSLDRLFRLLVALDDDVSIVIGPKREGRARLSVTARPA